jgi:septal ring factor EnvC (AmiA/AmiB activator)
MYLLDALNSLKSFDVDRISADDAVGLAAIGKSIQAEYAAHKLTAPEWLGEKLRSLDRWIEAHRRDTLELRLKEARAMKSTLLTREEKRSSLDADIARLEAELGGAREAAPAAPAPAEPVKA